LREVLGAYLGEDPGAVSICEDDAGKPYLAAADGRPGLQFNLAHTRGVAVVAAALDRPVGADIERIDPDTDLSVAEQFLGRGELDAFLPLDRREQVDTFFSYWTRKEALLKATGEGLAGLTDLSAVALSRAAVVEHCSHGGCDWTVRRLDLPSGWAGAVVVRGDSMNLRCQSLEQLGQSI